MAEAAMGRISGTMYYRLLGLAALLVFAAGIGAWMALTSLAGAIIAYGHVEPASAPYVLRVAAPVRIDALFVEDGQFVTQGDLLMRLDDDGLLDEIAALHRQITEGEARRARFLAEQSGERTYPVEEQLRALGEQDDETASVLAGQENLFESRLQVFLSIKEGYASRRLQMQARIQGLMHQFDALQRQAEIATDRHDQELELARNGLTTAARLDASEMELVAHQASVAAIGAEIASMKAAISELDIDAARHELARQEKASAGLAETEEQLRNLRDRLAQAAAQMDERSLSAPISGRVFALSIDRAGDMAGAGEIATLVPVDDGHVVVARVSPADIDAIHVGQPARIRIAGLGGIGATDIAGVIHSIPVKPTTHGEAQGEAFEIRLTLDELDPALTKLRAGMYAEVAFLTGDRAAWLYFAEPILKYTRRAFRESS